MQPRRSVILLLMLCLTTTYAGANDVKVLSVVGNVTLVSGSQTHSAKSGSTYRLPLEITTGAASSLRLEQGNAELSVGPNTKVMLPSSAPQSTWQRVRQQIGNVLYSVKPGSGKSFAVDTPYLVSVVKGTTFSVAVTESSADVALLEGSLDVHVPDADTHVLLKPNEVARRAAGDTQINVTTVPTAPPAAAVRMEHATATANAWTSEGIQTPEPLALGELNEIAASHADRRALMTPAPQPTPEPVPAPSPTPQPEPPVTPGPEPQPQPSPEPPAQPEPQPPPPDEDDDGPPRPGGDDDEDDDDNGYGNDDDEEDGDD